MTILKIAVVLAAFLATPAFAQSGSGKVVFITEKEAVLPAASSPDMTFRAGITRGPKVVVVLPAEGAAATLNLPCISSFGSKLTAAQRSIPHR